jgi:hypothetical protein
MTFSTCTPAEAIAALEPNGAMYHTITDIEVMDLLRNAFTRIEELETKLAALEGACRAACHTGATIG